MCREQMYFYAFTAPPWTAGGTVSAQAYFPIIKYFKFLPNAANHGFQRFFCALFRNGLISCSMRYRSMEFTAPLFRITCKCKSSWIMYVFVTLYRFIALTFFLFGV